MMDFHILVVITCVSLASLFSLLFINKFFRRKTFEEIVAEKKAMTDKIYSQNKVATKKPKKLQQLKKEQKREKKQRQKEQQRDNNEHEQEQEQEQEQEESDAQSDHASVEDEQPQGLSKTHVEFEPDPEILTYNNNVENVSPRRFSNTDKENVAVNTITKQSKSKKEKKNTKGGILVNKNEPVAIKENLVEEPELNSFEIKQPKDVIEMKKQDKEKETKIKEEKPSQQQEKAKQSKKDKSNNKIEKQPMEQIVELNNVAKDIKQLDEKLVRQGSPKTQSNSNKVNSKTKKQNKETAATKELVVALDKLSETDTVGVSLLMNLFRRAELNRSEIQILIDYLLNKQQDMPTTHSEWSDDICQKLKRQLEEKERLLAEQQEASMGIQAKLRDLRTEVNNERAQMNVNVKAYIEKLQAKDQELSVLNQELATLNDKITLERQQFQAKLLHEKQASSQDLLAQLQLMQNELAHKDKCITELTCMMNASHQAVEDSQQKTSELIQTQVQQIRALEQQRDELEQLSNNRVFEMEQAKTLESENAENKVEIRNLQNALESANTNLLQTRKELETVTSELALARNVELVVKQNEIQMLHAKNDELAQQLAGVSNKSQEQSKEQSDMHAALEALKAQVAEKEQELLAFNVKNTELMRELTDMQSQRHQREQEEEKLKQGIDLLKTELAEKDKKCAVVESAAADFSRRENELLEQLQEQKEKNNDLRTKNWKLVEALQTAEKTSKQIKLSNTNVVQQQQLLDATQKSVTTAKTTVDSAKDEKYTRELFQRKFPDAVKACAGTALSLSFDQWIEQVLNTHIKQSISATTSSSHKSTQSNNSSNNHTQHMDNQYNNNKELSDGETLADSDLGSETISVPVDNHTKMQELAHPINKTDITVSELDNSAPSIVSSNDEQVNVLQHSNGEQNI